LPFYKQLFYGPFFEIVEEIPEIIGFDRRGCVGRLSFYPLLPASQPASQPSGIMDVS
jgi:hypothetical protein